MHKQAAYKVYLRAKGTGWMERATSKGYASIMPAGGGCRDKQAAM
jgi:hypothetical protein